jgi:hypothetical protein
MTIVTDTSIAAAQEQLLEEAPARRATFVAWNLEDCLDLTRSARATTRSRAGQEAKDKAGREELRDDPPVQPLESNQEPLPSEHSDSTDDELEAIKSTQAYWGAHNPSPNVHVAMDKGFLRKWVAAYFGDAVFGKLWVDPVSS